MMSRICCQRGCGQDDKYNREMGKSCNFFHQSSLFTTGGNPDISFSLPFTAAATLTIMSGSHGIIKICRTTSDTKVELYNYISNYSKAS